MIRTLTRRYTLRTSSSCNRTRMSSDNSGKYHQNLIPDANDDDDGMDIRNEEQSMVHQNVGAGTPHHDLQSDMEMMKERFAKLLLGEDMSGGGKGVYSALALSNAVTNLAASIFGEKGKLEPLAPERKARWRKEMDWLLSVTDHIVEFVPSQQISKDGTNMEVMVTRQRSDLLANIPGLLKLDAILIETLDNFGQEQEFWYVSKNENQDMDNSSQRDDKWWHPIVKVPENGLSETSRKRLQYQKESVNQVLKAAMNINAQVLSEIQIPESYIDSLPKNGRESLGDSIYKSITVDSFDPLQFLSAMDFSTEHKLLDFKNRIEASILIWKRKMNQKDGWNPWGSGISSGKRELFEVRAETILLLLKQQFPGVAQSSLDISKIQENRDVGLAIQESYSRVLESLAFSVMSRIEDVLHADSLLEHEGAARLIAPEILILSGSSDPDICIKVDNEESNTSKPSSHGSTPNKGSYLKRIENLNGLNSCGMIHID